VKRHLTRSIVLGLVILFLAVFSSAPVHAEQGHCDSGWKKLQDFRSPAHTDKGRRNECEKRMAKLQKNNQKAKLHIDLACKSYQVSGQHLTYTYYALCAKQSADLDAIVAKADGNHWFLQLINYLLGWITVFIISLVSWVAQGIDVMIQMAFLIPPSLKTVWSTLVTFANYIFALLLIAVSLMQILRLKLDNYALKKYLPSLPSAVQI